jgi:hypothetical protein
MGGKPKAPGLLKVKGAKPSKPETATQHDDRPGLQEGWRGQK